SLHSLVPCRQDISAKGLSITHFTPFDYMYGLRRFQVPPTAHTHTLSLTHTHTFFRPSFLIMLRLSPPPHPSVVITQRVRLTAKPKSNDPFESFRKGLEGVFGGWEKLGGGYEAFTEVDQLLDEPEQDLEAFRSSLIKQSRSDADKKKQDFTGYDLYDLIVEKWGVPYDVQINKTVFAGKPVLCYNVMWKYLGQRSFNMRKQDYLEHLEALAQLLKKWDRLDHFKQMLKESKKKPDAYFGYAVALPLDLPPDTLVDYFDDSYF
ncbi:unnamed protein product, partial [Choristocarpus tenellus]